MQRFLTILLCLVATSLFAGSPAVTVHLLDHTDKQKTKTRFYIDWKNNYRGIVQTKAATPEQAEEIIQLLEKLLTNHQAHHFCGHDAIYGIEATNAEGALLKTSLCFKCNTWVKPDQRLVISGKSGSENPLCKALRRVIELPPELMDSGK